MIVGGTYDKHGGKTSVIVKMLAKCLSTTAVNGGSIAKLYNVGAEELKDDLVIWMPDVCNEVKKYYPRKKRGGILICSKVMRRGTTVHDAVTRIFKMHGNAVITITVDEEGLFHFALIDALGNVWAKTRKLTKLAKAIKQFQQWMKGVKRVKSKSLGISAQRAAEWKVPFKSDLDTLCVLNMLLADSVERSSGNRYFGNVSTRCEALFPTLKAFDGSSIYVSKRNIDKERLISDDFVLAKQLLERNEISFLRERPKDKPSVDTPIQLELYRRFPDIRFMIHGHAYVADAPITEHYFPCGDMREVEAIAAILKNQTMCVNLRNHGFLAVGTDLTSFSGLLSRMTFLPKGVGVELVPGFVK